MPNKFVNKYIDYSQDGKILEIKSFNELGNIIEAQYNFKQDTLRLVYKYSPAKQNKFETITINVLYFFSTDCVFIILLIKLLYLVVLFELLWLLILHNIK